MTKNICLSELPKTLNLGWAIYEFKVVKKLKDSHEVPCFGMVDFDKQEILLDSSLEGEQATSTVIHECNHALFETFGLGTAHEDSDSLTTTNEILVETSTKCILLLRNLNPKLWKILFD